MFLRQCRLAFTARSFFALTLGLRVILVTQYWRQQRLRDRESSCLGQADFTERLVLQPLRRHCRCATFHLVHPATTQQPLGQGLFNLPKPPEHDPGVSAVIACHDQASSRSGFRSSSLLVLGPAGFRIVQSPVMVID